MKRNEQSDGPAESTKGRVFFAGGRDLERFVVWDDLRRRIIS